MTRELGNPFILKHNWNGENYTFYDDDLILYYNFDNNSKLGEDDNTFKDLSRKGNNGSCTTNIKCPEMITGHKDKGGIFQWNSRKVCTDRYNTYI